MQGARKKRTADSSDQIAGGEEGRKLNAETQRAQRKERKKGRKKERFNTEDTEEEHRGHREKNQGHSQEWLCHGRIG